MILREEVMEAVDGEEKWTEAGEEWTEAESEEEEVNGDVLAESYMDIMDFSE